MAVSIKDFGETAKGLAKNPLGIIALFIVLIYGFASLTVGFSDKLTAGERTPLIWFLVLFPVAVLSVFAWLVSCHHKKLYAPSDFKDEEHFLEQKNPDLLKLEFAQPQEPAEQHSIVTTNSGKNVNTIEGRTEERQKLYEISRGFFLAHILEPSKDEGQLYDIFIYLIRHKSDDFCDLEKSEFFLGHYWGNKIFLGTKVGNLIGVRTSAYGPFLCTCRITFKDGYQASISRYIDFEMGNYFRMLPKAKPALHRTPNNRRL